MEDAVDGHCVVAIFVENRVRKASDQTTAVIGMDSSVDFWIAADGLDASINTI